MAARAGFQSMQHGPRPSNRHLEFDDPNGSAPNTMHLENIHASHNSRQHNGHHFQNTTNNYAAAPPYGSVPIKPPEDPIHSEFIRACRQGQGPQRLGFLLGRGANIDHRDKEQWTPLHHSATSGSVLTLKYLVDVGADIHASEERIGTPLHCAASSGSTETAMCLLDAGADPCVSDEWVGAPLHHTAFVGSAGLARCLLERGADAHALGKWVGTPLSIAAARSHLAVIEVLLEYKVDVKQHCAYFGSAAHMACAAGDVDVLRVLHQKGANLDGMSRTCYPGYVCILEPVGQSLSSSLEFRLEEGETLFWGTAVTSAIVHGNLEATKFCLDSKPDVRGFRKYELTWHTEARWRRPSPIHIPTTTRLAIQNLDVDMLRLLLDRGVAIPEHRNHIFDLGVGVTRKAALNGANASACISLLMQHGIHNSCEETAFQRVGEDTILMAIMRRKHDGLSYQIAKAVLEYGAPVNAANFGGQTAIMIAAGTDHKSRVQCVELLCKHGADVDLEDKNGRTALRYAEKWGGEDDFTEVKWILQHASNKTSEQRSEDPTTAGNPRYQSDHEHQWLIGATCSSGRAFLQ